MKLLHWQFQYWHFSKYFISYSGTGVMNLFALTLSVLGRSLVAISTVAGSLTFKNHKSHCFGRALQHYYLPAN